MPALREMAPDQQIKKIMKITEEKFKEIIVEQLGVEFAEIKPESRFWEDLGADSLDMVELVMAVEEATETNLPDDGLEDIKTFGEALKFLESQT